MNCRVISKVHTKSILPFCFSHRNYGRNVVVTGIGLVTPLGCGTDFVWEKLLQNECGIRKVTFDNCELACKVGAAVPKGLEKHEFSGSHGRAVTLASSYAMRAVDEALQDAGWKPTRKTDQERTGIALGTALVDLQMVADAVKVVESKGPRYISPFFIPAALNNMAAGLIGAQHNLKGINHTVATACTTGAHAIGDAFRFIKHGDCDVIVAGGTEANLNKYGMAGFMKMRALSCDYNDEPHKSSRPFDMNRCGFVMGEGCGVLVLEEEQHALSRGASIYARIRGYGLSSDASQHITAPHPQGEGAFTCMTSALRESELCPDDVTYVNAHATSTKLGDLAENRAIKNLFGERSLDHDRFAVSSTKGAIGHLLGAAGSVEAAFTVLACYHGNLPATLNVVETEDEMNLNYVKNKSQIWKNDRRIALTNSFGFGGTNASLCFSNYF